MKPDDPKYAQKALEMLTKRGLASEIHVGYECHRRGWDVSMSGWFVDPTEKKPREIDVLAAEREICPLKLPDKRLEWASCELSLVIEVKSGQDGWAVIQATPTELPQMPGWDSELDYFADDSRVPHDGFDEGWQHTIHATQSWVGARVLEIFSPREDSAFDAMQQCAAATRALYAKAVPSPTEGATRALQWASSPNPPTYKTWHPVLVHGGRLFRVGLAADLRLEEIKWAPVVCRWQLPPGRVRRAACLVDVVAATALPEYLELMRRRADAIKKSFAAAVEKDKGATGATLARAGADY